MLLLIKKKLFRFVSSVLPSGSQDLSGDEVDTIIKFKSALGIDDPDAAAMHMEVSIRYWSLHLDVGDMNYLCGC